jgi:DNA recombination-dependent growth factor C
MLPKSLSFRRYAVAGKLPDPHSEELSELIAAHRFLGFSSESIEEVASGWVGFDNFLETHPNPQDHYEHGVLKLALRNDRLVMPAALVNAHVELERKALQRAGHERIGRRQLAEIRAGVIELLRPKIQPRTTFVRALWRLRDRRLYILATSESACDLFREAFALTFPTNALDELDACGLVGALEATRSRVGRLDQIEPADLRPATKKR